MTLSLGAYTEVRDVGSCWSDMAGSRKPSKAFRETKRSGNFLRTHVGKCVCVCVWGGYTCVFAGNIDKFQSCPKMGEIFACEHVVKILTVI